MPSEVHGFLLRKRSEIRRLLIEGGVCDEMTFEEPTLQDEWRSTDLDSGFRSYPGDELYLAPPRCEGRERVKAPPPRSPRP